MEHAPGHSLVAALKEGGGDDVQPLLVVLDTAQLTRAVHQDGVENVQEELEGVLVEEVDLVEVVDGEVDTKTGPGLVTNSITYSVDTLQSRRISVQVRFHQGHNQSLSQPFLTVSWNYHVYGKTPNTLCSSRINVIGDSRGLEGRRVNSKRPSRVQDRETRESQGETEENSFS